MGEGTDALELFDPNRLVSRLLGMGDIIGLVEKAQAEFDMASTEKMAAKLAKNSFDLQDFLDRSRWSRSSAPCKIFLA